MTQQTPKNSSAVDVLIDKLQDERQQMLVMFCKLAGLEPFEHDKPVNAELTEFSQILVDYVSVGHFEAYEQILNAESPNHQIVINLAEEVYPSILKTTDAALAFNDKYDPENRPASLDELSGDLSSLIAEVATRIDLEDQLINALRGVR